MGFGGEVQHRVHFLVSHDLAHQRAVADVRLVEPVAVGRLDLGQGREIGGIGQLVDIDAGVFRVAHELTAHGRSDEPRPSGNQYSH